MHAQSGISLALLSLALLSVPRSAKADEKVEESNENSSTETKVEETAEEVDTLVPSFGYKKGFFISDGGANKLVIQGRVQGRMEYTSIDAGDSRAHRHAFLVPRARLTMKGNAHTKRLSYKFQSDFGKGQVSLKDFFLDYRLGEGEVRVRLGQFKMPFGRQFISSSSKLEFVDRTIVDKYIGNGRDIGFELHNNLDTSPETEWAVGVFNGTGAKGVFSPTTAVDPITMETEVTGGKTSNVPAKIRPAVALRIGRNSEGMKGYSEADLEGGAFRYSVAAAVLTHFRYGAGAASTRGGIDFAAKQEGISATGGIYADMQGPKIADVKYAGVGAYAQLGYMVSEASQVALRYASITQKGGNNQQEVSGVFSIYEFSHGLKWQSDVSLLHTDDGAKTQDIRARSQVQLSF